MEGTSNFSVDLDDTEALFFSVDVDDTEALRKRCVLKPRMPHTSSMLDCIEIMAFRQVCVGRFIHTFGSHHDGGKLVIL